MRTKMGKSCKLWFCNRKHYALGLCHTHYMNKRKYNRVISPRNTDMLNALRAISFLKLKLAALGYKAEIEEILPHNFVGRCPACNSDKIAVLNWPTISIGCHCGEIVFDIDIPTE